MEISEFEDELGFDFTIVHGYVNDDVADFLEMIGFEEKECIPIIGGEPGWIRDGRLHQEARKVVERYSMQGKRVQ